MRRLDPSNADSEANKAIEEGKAVIKFVRGYCYPYIKHLKDNEIPHHKNRDNVVVRITESYKNYGGLVGLTEYHFVLEEKEGFSKALLKEV